MAGESNPSTANDGGGNTDGNIGSNILKYGVSHGQNARQQEANFYSPRTQAVHGGNVYTGYDPAYAAKNG
jgi:hypothetical protein